MKKKIQFWYDTYIFNFIPHVYFQSFILFNIYPAWIWASRSIDKLQFQKKYSFEIKKSSFQKYMFKDSFSYGQKLRWTSIFVGEKPIQKKNIILISRSHHSKSIFLKIHFHTYTNYLYPYKPSEIAPWVSEWRWLMPSCWFTQLISRCWQ